MCPHIACLLGAFALLTACKSTPLELVYAADVKGGGGGSTGGASGGAAAGAAGNTGIGGGAGMAGGGAGGTTPDAGPCSMVGAGIYVLRSKFNGLCLGQGAPTTVFGSPGFLLEFATDCRRPERSWQLVPTATPNVFSIKNLSSGFALDVYMATIRDGTPVITFSETGFDNQRFEVRARDEYSSELRPQHHPQSCVGATAADSAQITTCEPTDSTQAWQLQQSDCL